MTSNGDNTMLGATMSGLNAMLDDTQLADAQALSSSTLTNDPEKAYAKGTKTFQYDSCEVAKAASGLASYSVYPNAWMDNFTTY
jgi:DNA gyrase inhibitor GyrI